MDHWHTVFPLTPPTLILLGRFHVLGRRLFQTETFIRFSVFSSTRRVQGKCSVKSTHWEFTKMKGYLLAMFGYNFHLYWISQADEENRLFCEVVSGQAQTRSWFRPPAKFYATTKKKRNAVTLNEQDEKKRKRKKNNSVERKFPCHANYKVKSQHTNQWFHYLAWYKST